MVLCLADLGGVVDNIIHYGRPSDISLYHMGCLDLPNGHTTPLAAVVLNSLQIPQQHSLAEVLDTLRAAGATLHIQAPKCK